MRKPLEEPIINVSLNDQSLLFSDSSLSFSISIIRNPPIGVHPSPPFIFLHFFLATGCGLIELSVMFHLVAVGFTFQPVGIIPGTPYLLFI